MFYDAELKKWFASLTLLQEMKHSKKALEEAGTALDAEKHRLANEKQDEARVEQVVARLSEEVERLLKEIAKRKKTEEKNATVTTLFKSPVNVSQVALFSTSKPRAEVEVPTCFLCPLTKQVMEDPVVIPSGNTYERTAITAWLIDKGTDPETGRKTTTEELYPNHALKKAIEGYEILKQQHKAAASFV